MRKPSEVERWFHMGVPRLQDLSDVIDEYNRKTLAFSEDAFDAFAGIQSMLHRNWPAGLIYGHPEFFFDIALTWHPEESIRRRGPTNSSSKREGKFPSGSWLGWEGSISFPHDHELEPEARGVCDIEGYLEPVTDWYAMEASNSTERRLIQSCWHKYKSTTTEPLNAAHGWIRKDIDLESYIRTTPYSSRFHLPRNIPSYAYTHSSFAYQPFFQWYPIPRSAALSNPPLQRQDAFISARTSRARLYLGPVEQSDNAVGNKQDSVENNDEDNSRDNHEDGDEASDEEWKKHRPWRREILDARGHTIGSLQMHNGDHVADSERNQTIELVAISKGYTGRIFDMTLAHSRQKETGRRFWKPQLKDCYFVLWIEWEHGIAYRRGDGVVTPEAWDEAKGEELVDLILG